MLFAVEFLWVLLLVYCWVIVVSCGWLLCLFRFVNSVVYYVFWLLCYVACYLLGGLVGLI